MVNEVATARDLTIAAATWNAQQNNTGATSKFVTSIQIDPDSGEITITYNKDNVGPIVTDATLTMTPSVNLSGTFTALNTVLAGGMSLDPLTGLAHRLAMTPLMYASCLSAQLARWKLNTLLLNAVN